MSARNAVAVDLGAESGRVVLGAFDGARLTVRVVHRFGNAPRAANGLLRWDLQRIWQEVEIGLAKAAAEVDAVDSVGADGWGVDYGFLDSAGEILDDPVAYRDDRIRGMLDAAVTLVGHRRLYAATGIQLMEINTVVQLLAESRTVPGRARHAAGRTLLFVPDLVHHLLCGATVAERTMATTSAAYDVVAGCWATELLHDLGVPTGFLPEVVGAATDLGPMHGDLASGSALRGSRVIAPGTHDTASAVVGVPFTDRAAAYISSGTWSLVGVETSEPVVTDAARAANLTNEGGVGGTTRLLRNVAGLWLLQECRRQWAREGHEYTYERLVELAAAAPSGACMVNPDDPGLVVPGDMPARLRAYLNRTGQHLPSTAGELARCVLESLALRYRMVVEDLERVTERPISLLHVVGGGSRNALLNQLTADITGRPVHAGPVEATALGNVLVQLGALGELDGLPQMRDVVRASYPPRVVEPTGHSAWEEAYARFRSTADPASAGVFE